MDGRRTAVRTALVSRAVLVAALAATPCCQKNPAGPGGTGQPPGKTVTAIAISGLATLSEPGETSQLRAIVTFADGTAEDETPAVSWAASPADVVTITQGGLLTAVAYGLASVSVKYPSSWLLSTIPVRVLPSGTYVLTGAVTEAGFPVVQATVTTTSASGTRSTLSRDDGSFTLLPLAGDVVLRTEKDGYETQVARMTVDRDQEVSVDLRRRGEGMTGVYKLTVTASPSCNLPSEIIKRDYVTRVSEQSGLVVVQIGVPSPWYGGTNTLTGTRQGTALRLTVDDFGEIVNRTWELSFEGIAEGTLESGRASARLNGRVGVYTFPGGSKYATCDAADHLLEFVADPR
jgi:hypothetical protein